MLTNSINLKANNMANDTALLLSKEDVYEAIGLLITKRNLCRNGGYKTDLRVSAKLADGKLELINWEFALIPNIESK